MATSVFTTSPTLGATRDRRILESGDRGQAADRVKAIFKNRNVDLSTGAEKGESAQQRIARITNEVTSGKRTFADIRRSVDRLRDLNGETAYKAPEYPTTPPSLSAGQLGQLGERRLAADNALKEAMARAAAERARVDAEGLRQGKVLGRDFRDATRDGMLGLASRGVARNPRQAGRFLREQRDAETEARGELERDLAERRRALQMFLEDARRSRDDELMRVDMDEANMRADLERLFPAGAGG